MKSRIVPHISGKNHWYQLPVSEVIKTLATDKAGLTSEEASLRLKKYGHNELEFKRRSSLIRLLLQFHSPLIYILLASAAITAFLGMWVDAGVILAVVLINSAVGFIQEGKAEASIDSLRKMLVPVCSVIRDGAVKDIPARELVPGVGYDPATGVGRKLQTLDPYPVPNEETVEERVSRIPLDTLQFGDNGTGSGGVGGNDDDRCLVRVLEQNRRVTGHRVNDHPARFDLGPIVSHRFRM